MIYITGDTHSNYDTKKLNTKKFPEQKNLSRSDYLIICGDFGAIWGKSSKHDEYWLNWHENKNYTTLYIDGNHENHSLLNEYPIEIWNGGKIYKIKPHVYHLMRGQVFELDGNTFFTMGGASSNDIAYRTEGLTWWKEEEISEEEIEEAYRNLERYNHKIDYIITHTVCRKFKNSTLSSVIKIDDTKSRTEAFLDYIVDNVDYKLWFNGHFHIDRCFPPEKHYCLYNEIVRLPL